MKEDMSKIKNTNIDHALLITFEICRLLEPCLQKNFRHGILV